MTDVRQFLSDLPCDKMSGGEKFLAGALSLTDGKIGVGVTIKAIRTKWPQHIFNSPYSPAFYPMAKRKRWVLPDATDSNGALIVTQAGADHLTSLRSSNSQIQRGLIVFGSKATHTFDKTIRSLFECASKIDIADSYVDDTIFDVTLDAIPTSSPIRLLYGQVPGKDRQPVFEARVKRFVKQYPGFVVKKSQDFHDRFFLVNETGYLLGPSLKDAADRRPALLMRLDPNDSQILARFFEGLWGHAS